MAEAFYSVGVIDKATMRHFDESCLTTPPAIAPAEIKRLRERIDHEPNQRPITQPRLGGHVDRVNSRRA